MEIQDETNTALTNLRRNIYLTIMSSVDFEECTHKLMKLNVSAGQQRELCNMVIECCSQERTYGRFYGLIAERFSKLNRVWSGHYEDCFMTYYDTIHRYDANKLRNIARLFGHLFSSDSISWQALGCIRLTEADTTSSSRIFIKILFQELLETMGLKTLVERMKGDYPGLFPLDDAKNTRFSINYFTSIGLGALTESMREHLKKPVKQPSISRSRDSRSRSRSYSSRSRSYSSRSRSRSRSSRSYSSRSRSRSFSRSRSRSRSASRSRR